MMYALEHATEMKIFLTVAMAIAVSFIWIVTGVHLLDMFIKKKSDHAGDKDNG